MHTETTEMSDKPTVRAGRPTKEQAVARHAQLLDCALDHFLVKGFEQSTIDAIAADVSMTKRTVYARYPDKVSLFRAAVRLGTERHSVSDERIAATRVDDLEQSLINLARLRIDLIATPEGLRLQRIINTESYRFPEIFNEYYEIAALPSVRFLARLLKEETARGRMAISDPAQAANVFMSMVVSGPVRILVSGNTLSGTELDGRVGYAVRLFLDGALPR